ncbi:S1C family serine protease [Sphaerobacter thermophilus]|uniref:S1C family serine protease n=1 Tax=Sphaerobacter thermophilus TaxID=2057 RepID=UPI000DAFFC27|nr:MAG: signal protein PDZ [Sphaerobacter thermophilus]
MSIGNTGSTNLLTELSDSLANAVATGARSIVRIDARRRIGATGIIWRADGLIVTADHVLEREDDITVGLPDGRDLPARIVGRDPGTDIAVLRVDADGLTAATISPVEARLGHLVLALGRPRGSEPMATLGVIGAVSGPWRTWRGGTIDHAIRSDATLYPGFSGGPLIDTEGRLIGMNTSFLSRGLSVTLPAAMVERVVEALVSKGKVTRGYLGIATQPVALPQALRSQLGLTQESGLLIVGVEPDSPAERGGLLLGDIVIAFGGQPTTDPQSLQALLGPGSAGTQQPVRVVRGGAIADTTVTVGER